jgi:hypothetical protein
VNGKLEFEEPRGQEVAGGGIIPGHQ